MRRVVFWLVVLFVVAGLWGGCGGGQRTETPKAEKQAEKADKPAEQAPAEKKGSKPDQTVEAPPAVDAPAPKPTAGATREEPKISGEYRVERAVDGDTIEVSPAVDGETTVRLIGIDTPEVSGGTGLCGPEASDFTASRLEGKRVGLEFDEDRTDQYGRVLAYVWLGDQLFNETLVEKGYATVATYPPNDRYEQRFLEASYTSELPTCDYPAPDSASPEAGAGVGDGSNNKRAEAGVSRAVVPTGLCSN